MKPELRDALLRHQTDLDGALSRILDDEDLYVQCLAAFPLDQSMVDLDRALAVQAWDEAFTAVHSLKGLAGNMGFVPLFHTAAELAVLLHNGDTDETGAYFSELKRSYSEIVSVIRQYCPLPEA